MLHAAPTRALLIDLSAWIVMHPPSPEADARDFAATQYDRWRRKVKKAGAALEPLQDALGALNDLVAAEAVLARIGSSREPGAAALIGHSKRPALLARAAKAHDRLLAAPRFWR